MKKIFLASSFYEVTDAFLAYAKHLKGSSVTFIPTASNVEEVVFYVEEGKKALQSMGLIIDILDIATASYEDISNKIRTNDFIYITGGNTFYLLQEMKRTGTIQLIIEAVNNGKLYIGESAGAIIASPNIAYIRNMDTSTKASDLEDFSGLGLISFYPIPHYTNPPFVDAAHQISDIYSQQLDLQPFSNNEAILTDGSADNTTRTIIRV